MPERFVLCVESPSFLVANAAVNSNLKEVSLELGGKSASIVFEDADLDKAAASLAFSLLWSPLCQTLISRIDHRY